MLVDLLVDRVLPSANSRMFEIVIFRQDNDYFGLRAPRGQFSAGQTARVVMNKNGDQISWPVRSRIPSPT